MVTFKGGWDKLYYTQHTLLSNIRQLSILFIIDDAENNTTSESHVPRTIANGTCTTKRNNLAESTDVVPTKHPPKVKLELFLLL